MTSIGDFHLGPTAKGVAALSVSPCARYVAVADMSNDNIVYVYNVERSKMLLVQSSGASPISTIQWSRRDNDLKFVALTSTGIQFWNPANSNNQLIKKGHFGKYEEVKLNCASYDEDGVCYTGAADGSIYVWDQK